MKKNLTILMMPGVKHNALFAVLGGMMALAIGAHQFLSFVYTAAAETPSGNLVLSSAEVPNNDPFVDIQLEAHSAYVYDLAYNKVLFAHREGEKRPLASITKLMTALVARERASESAVVVIESGDLAVEGDTGLLTGERWRNEDLVKLMLLVSSNDAARAIASFVGSEGQRAYGIIPGDTGRAQFVHMMNERAHAEGFTTMEFLNESGLDIKHAADSSPSLRQPGGLGSARDVAMLITLLWKKFPDTVEITAQKDTRIVSQDGRMHNLQNTNEITGRIPGLVASKTGYTDLAGGNLAVIFDIEIGHPLVAVVLGSSYKGRFEDMEKLVAAALRTRN